MSHNFAKWFFTGLIMLVLAVGLGGSAQAQSTGPSLPEQGTPNAKIEGGLFEKLSAGSADYIVQFKQEVDLSPAYTMAWKARGVYVYSTLYAAAESSQSQAKNILDEAGLRYQTFIAGNELYVWSGTLESANTLAALPEVVSIRATRVYHLDPVVQTFSAISNTWATDSLTAEIGPQPVATENPEAITDWGILDVLADQFWSEFGIQGQGILVANIDTGVQWDHPALVNQYKCQANPTDPSCWYDPSVICGGGICDNEGHGTHTMGTMVADDDPSLTYIAGMAPQAQWIACKGCEYNWCSDFALNACADWILAPGGDPDNRPHVVNNSWGGGGGDTWYLAKVNAWRAAGTFPAFSAGNSYTCSSLGSPGDYQESFGSGSHRSWDRLISDFSSKGPSVFGHDPYTKPNISAPGEDVCSSVPGGWACFSGTSMASPHTAGAVALLWSCNPGLVGQIDQTFEILQDNADPPPAGSCGAPPDGEGNYTYGYGYLNVYASGLQWCGDTGSLAGHVYDTGMNPIDLARVFSTPGPYQTTTSVDGYYQMNMQVGTYTVTAEAFGYYPASTSVEIITDTTTTQDFVLEPAPSAIVSGIVTDATTGWPLYAYVSIAGYPWGGVWTDPVSGFYSVSLPEGSSYEFNVSAWVSGYLAETRSFGPLSGDRTESFALSADLDACTAPGYDPTILYQQDFEADNGGFSVYGYGWGGNSWEWGNPSPYPGPGEAHSGLKVWATKLDGNYYDGEDSYIESPDIDLSTAAGQGIKLNWWQWLQTEGCCDYAEVQVSNDGGSSWSTIYGPQYGSTDMQWTPHEAGLSTAYAVSNFRVRFHLWTDGSVIYPGWYLDDLSITGNCQTQEGGLVVGNVYDTNLGMPLTGASVSNDSGEATLTAATVDPAVDDSFYTLFSPAGSHVFTATFPAFNTVASLVEVITSDTVLENFYLPAGYLVADPMELGTTVMLGMTQTLPLMLNNEGDGYANFEIFERARSLGQSLGIASPEKPTYLDGNPLSGPQSNSPPFKLQSSRIQGGACFVAVGSGWDPEATELHNTLDEMGFAWIDVSSVQEARYVGANILLDRYAATNFSFFDISAWINDGFGYIQLGDWPEWFPETWEGAWSGTPLNISVADSGHPLTRGLPPSWTGLGFWAYDWDQDAVGWVWDTAYPNLISAGYSTMYDRAVTAAEYAAGRAVYLGVNVYGYLAGDADRRLFKNAITWSGDCGFEDIPWLSEQPITGTLTAGDSQLIQVTFDASLLGQPGDYLAELVVENDTPYGPLNIPVTMTVEPPLDWGLLEGVVSSLGYCDLEHNPLPGASVYIESSTGLSFSTETDANGYYSWWLDQDGSPYTVTVTALDHQGGQATGVVIIGQQTTTQDFDLRWLRPCVQASPPDLEISLLLGISDTLTMTLTNTGAAPTDFSLEEKDQGFIPSAKISVVVPGYQASSGEDLGESYAGQGLTSRDAFEYQFPPDVRLAADDIRLLLVAAADVTQIRSFLQAYPDFEVVDYYDARNGTPTLGQLLDYDCVVLISNFYFYDPVAMGDVLADYVDEGGTVVQTVPTFYGYGGWALSGRFVSEGYSPFIGTGDWFIWADLGDFDPAHPIMEGVTNAGDYYRQVMQLAPEAEWVANWTDDEFIATKGKVVALNTFLSDGYSWSGDIPLIVHNSVAWLMSGGDVPWLSETPDSGFLAEDGGMQVVEVTFDAGMVHQPGNYFATLTVRSDDPVNNRLGVPITMTVEPPPDWGRLSGVVTSLGYCDLHPAPLEGASVVVMVSGSPLTFTADQDGVYVIWLEQGSYLVNVSADEHLSVSAEVTVTAGLVTTQDFNLRWIAPCISGMPTSYSVEVPQGFSFSYPFYVVNLGARSSNFKLYDRTIQEVQYSTGRTAAVQPLVALEHQNAATTAGLGLEPGPSAAPLAAGSVIQSWSPTSQSYPWGIAFDGFDGTVWVGDGWGAPYIYEYEPDGSPTGRSHSYTWGPFYGPADDAFNWNTGMVWTLDVGNDDCLHEMDPSTGYTINTLCGPWSVSQRGAAYDPATNTWFVGGWNDGMIYHLDSAGGLLDSAYVGLSISGLAYNPGTAHLFVMVNDWSTLVYVLDVLNYYQIVGQFSVSQGFGSYAGAGLEIDCDGNLWAVDQSSYVVYQFESGETASLCEPGIDAPWLSENPQEGTVAGDSSYEVELTFTAFPTMPIGSYYTATLILKSEDWISDTFRVPAIMTVIEPVIQVGMAPVSVTRSSPPGSAVYYQIDIQNAGNVLDTYVLTLEGEDWPTLMLQHQVSLAPGASASVGLYVFIPSSAGDGEMDAITVRAISQVKSSVSATSEITTLALYPRIVRLTPAEMTKIGKAGEMAEFQLTLWNFSSVADTIELSVQSNWIVHLPATTFTLDSFEDATVTVQVFIPPGADVGSFDEAVITATSLSDPTAWDASSLMTYNGLGKQYLPMVMK